MKTASTPFGTLIVLGLSACASGSTAASADRSPTPEPAAAAQPAAPTPTAEPSSAGDALSFSVAQANRGRDVFRSSCTECHNTSEFSDRQFKFKWQRRTAGDLYGHIVTTMPEDAPGSLEAASYAALVAYIMRMNGFEPGDGELPADEDALKAISLAPIGN